MIQQMPDILVLNRRGANKPAFETMSKVASKSKDLETQELVKYIEYHPRLRGVTELPELIDPTVSAIMELKNAGKE